MKKISTTKIKKRDRKKGMTLPEATIGVAIVVILMGMISLFVIKSFETNRYSYEQGLNNAALQNSLRSVVTNLREAKQGDSGEYMLISADDFELVFFANVDDDPATERVHYYLEDGQFKMGLAEAAGFPAAYPENDQEVKAVGNGITNSEAQPLFYYYTREYPIESENNPLATPANVDQVGLIKVDVFANVDPEHAPDSAHIETFVRPRNIK